MKKLIAASILALAIAAVPTNAANPPFDTPAPIAYLEDLSSGAVLYAKDADRRIPPASMAKMMTVYVAFDLIKQGKLKLDQQIEVQPETWKKWHSQGSTMFLAVGEKPTVED
ncbi:MAG: D-alanyl-D-alanine carboxypeptidase, partial [Sphingomonadales bacterium]